LNIEIKEDIDNEDDEHEYLTSHKKRSKRDNNQLPRSLSKLSIGSENYNRLIENNINTGCIGILEVKDLQKNKVPLYIPK